jgi:cation diffusion facilitator family transporter
MLSVVSRMTDAPKSTREVRAIQIAIATSIVGSIVKFTVGAMTGSMSMLSSGIDSLGDLFVSIVNLMVVRIADQAPDEEHNYGHVKVEGLGAMFEGGFIFAAGAFIIYEAVHKALIGEESHDSLLGIFTMLPILGMTFATVLHLRKVAKETGSLIVKTDALHYMTDVWVNVGVLVSLVLVHFTGMPIIDSIISALIGLYMLYSATHVVREGLAVVMDESLDKGTVEKLRAMLGACKEIDSFHDFKTRTGRIPHVDFHVVVDGAMSAQAVHDLFLQLERDIRALVGPNTKVMLHADPRGHSPRAQLADAVVR